MSTTDERQVVIDVLEYHDVEYDEDATFEELQDTLMTAIHEDEVVDPHLEIELSVTLKGTVSVDPDSIAFSDDVVGEFELENITRRIADDGASRALDVEGVEVEEFWDL